MWNTIRFYPDSKHYGRKVLRIRLEKKRDEGMYWEQQVCVYDDGG